MSSPITNITLFVSTVGIVCTTSHNGLSIFLYIPAACGWLNYLFPSQHLNNFVFNFPNIPISNGWSVIFTSINKQLIIVLSIMIFHIKIIKCIRLVPSLRHHQLWYINGHLDITRIIFSSSDIRQIKSHFKF